jgi:hypothetical protein
MNTGFVQACQSASLRATKLKADVIGDIPDTYIQSMKLPKRLIFALSSGRSGTKHLSRIMGVLPGVASLHEPTPNFSAEMQAAQKDPTLARKFLVEHKLPEIAKIDTGIYAEVTSMWCKGLLLAWLEEPGLPTPDVVILDRDPRKIALSLFRLELTPERTLNGRQWYMGPGTPSAHLKVGDFSQWSDYQLCYWYAMEIEVRKTLLGNMISARGGRVHRTSIDKLSTPGGALSLVKDLELPRPGLAQLRDFLWLLRRRTNTQGSEKWESSFTKTELSQWEEAVIAEVLHHASRNT